MQTRKDLINRMTEREYNNFAKTGSTESTRRKSDDFYTYKHNPLPKSELPKYAHGGVLVIKKHGAPRFVELTAEQLDTFWSN